MDFGDIFTLAENQYVYLTEHEGYIFGALIRETEASQALVRARNKQFKDGYTENMIAQSLVPFQFVKLRTYPYSKQVASVNNKPSHRNTANTTRREGEKLSIQDTHDLCVIIEKSREAIEPVKVVAAETKSRLPELLEDGKSILSFDESQDR